MVFKYVVFAAVLAYANAGLLGAPAVATYSAAPAVSTSYIHQAAAPVVASPVVSAYSSPLAVAHAAPVAIHAPAIGASQQNVIRGLGGAQAISTYSKAVDSAFSSVRKYDTRITNDALSVSHAPVVSAYGAAAPVVSAYGHAAPVVSAYGHAAPVVSAYSHAAPVVSAYGHAAPVVSAYGASPLVAHASPLTTYAAHAAPVVTKTAAVAYSPAAVVSHATFSGLGASYGW